MLSFTKFSEGDCNVYNVCSFRKSCNENQIVGNSAFAYLLSIVIEGPGYWFRVRVSQRHTIRGLISVSNKGQLFYYLEVPSYGAMVYRKNEEANCIPVLMSITLLTVGWRDYILTFAFCAELVYNFCAFKIKELLEVVFQYAHHLKLKLYLLMFSTA